MNLRELLDKLPALKEDGTYFELRKVDTWMCVKSNFKSNTDSASNIGRSPEEAVRKMLVRLGIEKGCLNCLHSYEEHDGGCTLCSCKRLEC